jgi:hypothetical protein
MTVFRVEKYVVRPEKHEEYVEIMKKWADYVTKNKEKCKELRSWKLFVQAIGGNVGEYIEMRELESLSDYESSCTTSFMDKMNLSRRSCRGLRLVRCLEQTR